MSSPEDHDSFLDPGLDDDDEQLLTELSLPTQDAFSPSSLSSHNAKSLLTDIVKIECMPGGVDIRRVSQLAVKLVRVTQEIPGELLLQEPIDNIVFSTGERFADTYHARFCGRNVDVKRLSISQPRLNKAQQAVVQMDVVSAAVLWRHINHENIVPFFGFDFIDKDGTRSYSPFNIMNKKFHLCSVSLRMPNGPILQYLSARRNECVSIERLLLDVAQGLAFLHRHGVVFGNLTTDCVLIDCDGRARLENQALIAAFHSLEDPKIVLNLLPNASTRFWAPERIETDGETSTCTDVFSYACICYHIYTLKPPLYNIAREDSSAGLFLMQGKRPARPSGHECPFYAPSDYMWTLIERCWDANPERRASIEDVVVMLNADTSV